MPGFAYLLEHMEVGYDEHTLPKGVCLGQLGC